MTAIALADPARLTESPAERLRRTAAAVRVHFTWLGTHKALTTSQKEEVGLTYAADSKLLTAGKRLIDVRHERFKAMTALKSRIAGYWRSLTLPYVESGVRLIRQSDLGSFIEAMGAFRAELHQAEADLNAVYEQVLTDARHRLGRLFNGDDYPTEIRGLFDVEWDFPSVEPPGYLMRLNPDLFRQEQERAKTASRRYIPVTVVRTTCVYIGLRSSVHALFGDTMMSTVLLLAGLFAVASPVDEPAKPIPPSSPANPMANYARLIGGEWQTTFASGEKGYQAWQWGPGKYSIRKMAYATGTADNPWGGEIMYWHPGRKVVWVLSLHEDIPALGRGVSEGHMKFEGDTAEGVAELHQPRGPRKLGNRWVFDGPDKYRDTLLEDTGAGLKPMNGWEFVRVKERVKVPPKVGVAVPAKLPPHLKVFETLLGHTWGAQGDLANAFHIQTSFELIPSLEVIIARVVSPNKGGEPTQLLDVYFYHHLGTKQLRCLALSNRGGVYEGTWAVDGEGLQLDLKGYEGDKVVPHVVRLDLEKNGTLRSQVCTINGAEKKVLFEVRLKR